MENIKLPEYEISIFGEKKNKYAICIPVLNEGDKFIRQLSAMNKLGYCDKIDIIICDGNSTDGCTNEEFLKKNKVRAKLIRISKGHMSDQLMLGYYFALKEGYQGVITIDGNEKDGLEGIDRFIEKLEQGYDLIQGSRFIQGGESINTPLYRTLAIRAIHTPVINFLSKFKYTDTTNGFRGHSIRVFKDEKVAPFRYGEFPTYSLIHYLTVRVPRLGYKVCEVPVKRMYPESGPIPTKISPFKGNADLIKILCNLLFNKYNPKE